MKRPRMDNLTLRKEMWRFAGTLLPDGAVPVIAVEESILMMASNMFLYLMRHVGIFNKVGADTETVAGVSILQLRRKVRTLTSKKFQKLLRRKLRTLTSKKFRKLSKHRMYETRYEKLIVDSG